MKKFSRWTSNIILCITCTVVFSGLAFTFAPRNATAEALLLLSSGGRSDQGILPASMANPRTPREVVIISSRETAVAAADALDVDLSLLMKVVKVNFDHASSTISITANGSSNQEALRFLNRYVQASGETYLKLEQGRSLPQETLLEKALNSRILELSRAQVELNTLRGSVTESLDQASTVKIIAEREAALKLVNAEIAFVLQKAQALRTPTEIAGASIPQLTTLANEILSRQTALSLLQVELDQSNPKVVLATRELEVLLDNFSKLLERRIEDLREGKSPETSSLILRKHMLTEELALLRESIASKSEPLSRLNLIQARISALSAQIGFLGQQLETSRTIGRTSLIPWLVVDPPYVRTRAGSLPVKLVVTVALMVFTFMIGFFILKSMLLNSSTNSKKD